MQVRLNSAEQLLEFRISNFNVVAAVLGGSLSIFGLVSYLFKEKFYLSEALISLLGGVVFSPHAANWIRPLEYANGSEENVEAITLYFTRLTLGVQLVLAGIQLPSKYLKYEWKSLSLLLGPVMCAMWVCTSLLVWAMVPNLSFLHALAVGACVTPTDPVLSNSIVKGKFADRNIPKDLQKVIIGESGANDGLGYPFLFLALYLIRYVSNGGAGQTGGAGKAMGYWFGITWGYVIIMSVIYGALVGYIFRKALRWAEDRKFVDRESFLVFAITIALFIVGTMGMLGSDDVLACFIAGNSFTWDDWFRLQTMDDSFQPTIDMLLNVTIFAWYGAVCPWSSFLHNDVIPIYRLIFLGILVLLFRRLPVIMLIHKKIPQIEQWRQAGYVGFFGPIGVSAVFYLYTSVDYLREITLEDGSQRPDAARLSETITVVVWFMAICSIVVHGMTIPLSKFGLYLPRTVSRALSVEKASPSRSRSRMRSGDKFQQTRDDDDGPQLPSFHLGARIHEHHQHQAAENGHVGALPKVTSRQKGEPERRVFKIGHSIIKPRSAADADDDDQDAMQRVAKVSSSSSNGGSERPPNERVGRRMSRKDSRGTARSSTPPARRLIRFPADDEDEKAAGKADGKNENIVGENAV